MLTGVTLTPPSSYLYFQVCVADCTVQLLLSELLSAVQSLKLVVSERRSQLTDVHTLRTREKKLCQR